MLKTLSQESRCQNRDNFNVLCRIGEKNKKSGRASFCRRHQPALLLFSLTKMRGQWWPNQAPTSRKVLDRHVRNFRGSQISSQSNVWCKVSAVGAIPVQREPVLSSMWLFALPGKYPAKFDAIRTADKSRYCSDDILSYLKPRAPASLFLGLITCRRGWIRRRSS